MAKIAVMAIKVDFIEPYHWKYNPYRIYKSLKLKDLSLGKMTCFIFTFTLNIVLT